MSRKTLSVLLIAALAINIVLIFWFALNNDLGFHTDIARDFLVLEDIVKTRKPTLIGPHAGGIQGVFHGPLWYYIHLPIFLVGRGNPIAVSWFWGFLTLTSLGVTYYVGKKLFNKEVALLTTVLLSAFAISYTNSLFNPYGAVILFPLFFYLFWLYLKRASVVHLLSCLFVLGLIIQFQIAFGLPILILTTIYLVPFIIKQKRYKHIFAYLILLIPLSTYILFEIRHDFFQIRSLISYVTVKQAVGELTIPQIILSRIKGFFLDGLYTTPYNSYLSVPVAILFIWIGLKLRNSKAKFRTTYFLFFYFYSGFWLLSFLFRGVVWNYYYWPFLPVVLLIFCSSIQLINKKLFFLLLTYIFLINFYFGFQKIKMVGTGWRFYHSLAKDIYSDADNKEFGYYVYTADQLGYSEKYALHYTQREYSKTKSFPYEKKKTTYLIIASPPRDKPYLNGEWWKTNQIKISGKPKKVKTYRNGERVEKYILVEKELKIPSDPNLIQTLLFR